MNITAGDVKEFQQLYFARFGLEISEESAYKKLALLLRQMELIYQPIRAADMKNISEDENEYEAIREMQNKAC